MDEYISRQKVLEEMHKWCDPCGSGTEAILAVPAADVAPVKHGYWVIDDNNTRECHCSECEWPAPRDVYEYHREQTGYCPVCGAKMELED